jgi:D-lactate dehydrogenase (cytochrome)
VVSIVKIASRFSIPLIPYSGGTALEGHYNAPFLPSGESKEEGGDLQPGLSFVVNFSENMDRIIEVHGKQVYLVSPFHIA